MNYIAPKTEIVLVDMEDACLLVYSSGGQGTEINDVEPVEYF